MAIWDGFDLNNILFLDIETAPIASTYDELSDELQELWAHKVRSLRRQPEVEEEIIAHDFEQRAGIYAEFGKIICISVGVLRQINGDQRLRLKSFYSHTEADVLQGFSELLEQKFSDPSRFALCGHNIREFDVPYICRRLVVNQLPLPRLLDIAGMKPWETKHLLDTMEMWKFGDVKSFTSLRLLAAVLGFPSPKDDIDGGDVSRVYWEDRDLERIASYCEKDVVAAVQLFLRFRRQPLLSEEQIEVVR
ncbi:MAG: ribonuclease H-like domain-containing protein [Saprospiraceae bacterium]|nr:ribonuclease H-like domain-containing protein [Saprospiraceae bacterium]MDW8483706.1 ribonuclease H-like domain-containing protein [Saprospiraceae bacterium]